MGQPARNNTGNTAARLCLLFVLGACPATLFGQTASLAVAAKPPDAPADWKRLLGSYAGEDKTVVEVLENDGHLELKDGANPAVPLLKDSDDHFSVTGSVNGDDQARIPVQFVRGGGGQEVREIIFGHAHLQRRAYDAGITKSFHITPVRPLEELRKEAMQASPPQEARVFRKPELVELVILEPSIHLDIRYATANNFLGTPVYTQPRAFLQRPAAAAMIRALQALKPYGYGLLIHDGYRPWYVTKIFWEATPPEGKIFVADPSQGSRHNRGCAVDLTLYDLKTGAPLKCPGPTMKCRRVRSQLSRRNFAAALEPRPAATLWSQKALQSSKQSGGISTTRIGGNTRF